YPGLPWPILATAGPDGYPNGPPTLPLPCIAREGGVLRKNYIDRTCWRSYAVPLMQKAHGYAQSVFSLALPPARAELVPDSPLDLRKWRLRVWNLGTGDNAVTWHVDKASLKPI